MMREWHVLKLRAAFAAFFGVLRVRREEVMAKVGGAAKKYGVFKPEKIRWEKEHHEECIDSLAYTGGQLFTHYLQKYEN